MTDATAVPAAAPQADAGAAAKTRGPGDWAARQTRGWLWAAVTAVAILAAASAAASWNAQYTTVIAVRHEEVIAAIEAGVPDSGALFFACLGIALALHGRRALRARALNAGCIAVSLAMNAMASSPGWRDLAVWIMPSAMYAVASDTLIAVIRAFTTEHERGGLVKARRRLATALLWALRLTLAFPSTFSGFRRWVIEEGPVAPGHRGAAPATRTAPATAGSTGGGARPASRPQAAGGQPRRPSKQQQMITAAGRRANLSALPLAQVPKVATAAAGEVGLHPTTARRVLRQHVLGLQGGQPAKVNQVNGSGQV